MIRFLVRTLGLWLLAGGFAAAVIDGMASVAASAPRLATAAQSWKSVFPATFESASASLAATAGPTVRDAVFGLLGLVPTCLLLGIVGFALVAIARDRSDDRPAIAPRG